MSKIGRRLYRLQADKTLFLLCDIQEKFKPAIPLLGAVIENSKKLVEAGKVFNIPLLVTEQYPEKLGPTVCEIDIKHACGVVPKTKFSMVIPPVEEKMKSIFGGTPQTAVLFGIETHVCIEQTAFDLLNKKINVWLVADCCASRLNQDRDLALERLRDIGCTITSTESVIFNLLSDKNHKSFKDIAGLVKKVSADLKIWLPTTTSTAAANKK
ncbi:isochorismatase domain-containing protein 1 [Drosophila sulfurigaster albostrigata]|uniref:isochorismatase domain-containing protein 1 n=1 Tax=Drosophila sulfurigaster albostrigata TaxID=89887 RepID=UPI002D21D6EA|nr:isochorismatase domain-containing protein 1 [Drosophila sulfurigaster albostrigata]